jgi:hypothetical protein
MNYNVNFTRLKIKVVCVELTPPRSLSLLPDVTLEFLSE